MLKTGEARLLARARSGDEDAFRELVDPYRRELQVHCYRIVGSVQDAEDLLQETLLSAWRGLDRYRGDAGLRTWLYRIATNGSLNALRARKRRSLPMAQEPPPPEMPEPTRLGEAVHAEPYPDLLLEGLPDPGAEPEARYDLREAIEISFVVALQHLPPRQRAVLVLRDVLGFRAREAAEILDTTEASVNGALQRARATLERARASTRRESAPAPQSPAERQLVTRFADAFERGDIPGLLAVLSEDAALTMPPQPFEFYGREAICDFLSTVPAGGDLTRLRLVPTRANLQPAFALYLREPQGARLHAYGFMVLTVGEHHVRAITGFPDTSCFPTFGLPRTIYEER
jgi:RNA polymerase sigma-70 factor (TIGR02960 family)